MYLAPRTIQAAEPCQACRYISDCTWVVWSISKRCEIFSTSMGTGLRAYRCCFSRIFICGDLKRSAAYGGTTRFFSFKKSCKLKFFFWGEAQGILITQIHDPDTLSNIQLDTVKSECFTNLENKNSIIDWTPHWKYQRVMLPPQKCRISQVIKASTPTL